MTTFQLELTALCLLILIAGFSCGKLGTIDHTGSIGVKVTVDTGQLDSYFARYCCKQQLEESGATPDDSLIGSCAATPTQSIIDCSKDWTADFLAAVTSVVPTNTPVTGG